MDLYHLLLFLLNILLLLVDAGFGYHLAPHLFAGLDDAEAAEAGVRTVRSMLTGIVTLYMFFNCLGYFQGRTSYLLSVGVLILADLAMQMLLRRKNRGAFPFKRDEGE